MTAPFSIRQLDHIVLRVADLDRMLRFYVEVLGCSMERTQAEIGLYQVRAGSSLLSAWSRASSTCQAQPRPPRDVTTQSAQSSASGPERYPSSESVIQAL